MKRNDDGYTYMEWIRKVDGIVIGLAGVSVHDLADGPSYDSWADGVPPRDYAEEMLADEGFPFAE